MLRSRYERSVLHGVFPNSSELVNFDERFVAPLDPRYATCLVWQFFYLFGDRWRAYIRDPRAPGPRPLDTGLLLCEGHGLLLAPPHVEEYLSGERRSLLGGLDPDRSGCVCEILTPEEWDTLTLVSIR